MIYEGKLNFYAKVKELSPTKALYRLAYKIRVNARYYRFVVVASEMNALGQKEAAIYPADEEGNILAPKKLFGTTANTYDHKVALRNAGWNKQGN